MIAIAARVAIDWRCRHTWRRASKNTAWCLLGCTIGDFATIVFFEFTGIPWPTTAIMILAIVNGLLTSIALETFILVRQMDLGTAFRTAIGMSFVSMVAMEAMMNAVDWSLDRRRGAHLVGCADHAGCRLRHPRFPTTTGG